MIVANIQCLGLVRRRQKRLWIDLLLSRANSAFFVTDWHTRTGLNDVFGIWASADFESHGATYGARHFRVSIGGAAQPTSRGQKLGDGDTALGLPGREKFPKGRKALAMAIRRLGGVGGEKRCLDPVAGREEVGVEFFFCAAGFGLPVVAPFDDGRQRHQDGFGASA